LPELRAVNRSSQPIPPGFWGEGSGDQFVSYARKNVMTEIDVYQLFSETLEQLDTFLSPQQQPERETRWGDERYPWL
jgi:hypothetical protein